MGSEIKQERDKVLIGLLVFCGLFYASTIFTYGAFPGIYLVFLSRATLNALGIVENVRGNAWYELGEGAWGVSIIFSLFWPITLLVVYLITDYLLCKIGKGGRFSAFLLLSYLATVLLTTVSFYAYR